MPDDDCYLHHHHWNNYRNNTILGTMSKRIEMENRLNNLEFQVIDLKCRATGRTTRLVDDYIQQIYNHQGEWVKIADHHPSKQAAKVVFDKVCGRLKYEHSGDEFKVRRMYGFEIMLVKCARDGVLDEMKRLHAEINELKQKIKEL